MALPSYVAVLKAAGDPARARIIKLLEGRELSVCELPGILGLSQSTVSGHLGILRKSGLVKVRKSGRQSYYSLSDRKTNDYSMPLLALLMGWLDDDPSVRADRRKLAAQIEKRELDKPGI